MKKSFGLLVLVLSLLVAGVDAWDQDLTAGEQLLVTHDVLLDALSWKSFPLICAAGDILSGEFILTSNGDLYIGDETKYDNWLLTGIDFLILDTENYDLWIDDFSITPFFEKNTVFKLTWSVEIPSDGTWYVIYFNDSIFMKQVEGSIQHISQTGFTLTFTVIGLAGCASLLTLAYLYKKKK